MVQTKIWQMTLFQDLILFTNHYGNLQEMLQMASFLRYVDLYLTSECGGPVLRGTPCIIKRITVTKVVHFANTYHKTLWCDSVNRC
jgi:hypothetical protein